MTVANSSCPSYGALTDFVLGRLDEAELERIERHLADCPTCGNSVEVMNVDDTLVELVRTAGTEKPEAEAVEDLVQRLRELTVPPSATARPLAWDDDASPTVGTAQELSDFLDPPQAPDEMGRLGTYRVLGILGAGGMGVVFQAEDVSLKRLVALKVLKPALAVSEGARQRFLREARSVAAIEHEHIVTIYQVGQDGYRAFLAMQWLQGETLEERLKREGRLPMAEVLRIGRETALGLAAAHKKGLIHRDIKPANIWLEAGHNRVKIVDFGLARAADDSAQLTAVGSIAGTPAYMAPEQAQGKPVDARCDLFALGCVLYRMATGRLPFHGPTALATLRAVEEDQPPSPSELNAEVPVDLSRLIMRLLEKEPAKRQTSADEVADAIQEIERRGSSLGLPAVIPEQVGSDRSDQARTEATAPSESRHITPAGKRSSQLAITATVAAFVVLAAVLSLPRLSTRNAVGTRSGSESEPLQTEYHFDFRGSRFDPQRLLPLGFQTIYGFSLIKREPEGLRIVVPSHQRDQKPSIGFAPACEIVGDFEITAAYEILKMEPAIAGPGVGASLFIMAKGTPSVAILRRCLRPGYQPAFMVRNPSKPEAPAEFQYFPATTSWGALRMTRTGSILRYLVAEGADGQFCELAQVDFGATPVGLLKVEAVAEGAGSAIDLRWQYVRIRAEQLNWTTLELFRREPDLGAVKQ